MAASTISPAALASARQSRLRRIAGSALDHWHLLSLDAPTVAVVWTVSFAATAHLHLPVMGPTMLALATWLLYVADRLLDSVRPAYADRLQTRHYFHLRHRTLLLVAATVILPPLAWLVATRLDRAPRREDLVLTACSIIYLVCVHFPLGRPFSSPGRPHLRLPKELIVGIIFAAACVIPTWSREPLARPVLALPLILFAILCWLNCVAIEYWESPTSIASAVTLHPSTLWIGRHFHLVTGMVAAISLAAIPSLFGRAGHHWTRLAAIDLSIAASCCALAWLHHTRRSLDPLRLRAAADTALLTPALLVPAFILLARHIRLA